MNENKEISDVLLVSYNITEKEGKPLLLVSRRGARGEQVIISGYTGDDATDIYNKLIEGGEL